MLNEQSSPKTPDTAVALQQALQSHTANSRPPITPFDVPLSCRPQLYYYFKLSPQFSVRLQTVQQIELAVDTTVPADT